MAKCNIQFAEAVMCKVKCVATYHYKWTIAVLQRRPGLQIIFLSCKGTCMENKIQKFLISQLLYNLFCISFSPNLKLGVYCELCSCPIQWAFWSGSTGSWTDYWDLLGWKVSEDTEEHVQSSGRGQEQCGAGGGDPAGSTTSEHCVSQRPFWKPSWGCAHSGAVSLRERESVCVCVCVYVCMCVYVCLISSCDCSMFFRSASPVCICMCAHVSWWLCQCKHRKVWESDISHSRLVTAQIAQKYDS